MSIEQVVFYLRNRNLDRDASLPYLAFIANREWADAIECIYYSAHWLDESFKRDAGRRRLGIQAQIEKGGRKDCLREVYASIGLE